MSVRLENKERLQYKLEDLEKRVIQLEKSEKEYLEEIQGLKEWDKTFKAIFRVVPAGMGMLRDCVFVEINTLASEITGYLYEELVGENRIMNMPETIYLSDFSGNIIDGNVAEKKV